MNALLIVAALLIVFVLAELLARALLPRLGRYYVWTPNWRLHMPLDCAVFPNGDEVVRIEANALGERGAPLPADLARCYRVLIGGGSAAECFFLDQHSSWPEALGRALSAPDRLARLQRASVHVGNVAHSLTDCRALVELFARILPRLPRSDATVLMTGASDLVRWLEEHTPATIPEGPIAPASLFARHPEGPFGWTPSTLALRRIAAALRQKFLRPVERREKAGRRLSSNRAMRANAKRMLTSVADPAPMLAHYEKHLRRLVPLLQRHSARVLLVRQPWIEKPFTPAEERQLWMFGNGRAYDQQVDEYYDRAVIYPLLRRIDEVTVRVARELGAESLELRSRIPADFEHYYDDMHNTPLGCAIIGELVARALVEPPQPR